MDEVDEELLSADSCWTLAYEEGLRIYHETEAPKWIDRNGSHSAADLLTENGWEIVSKWVQTLDPPVWSCFVRRIEGSED